jgi:hypothetical protein
MEYSITGTPSWMDSLGTTSPNSSQTAYRYHVAPNTSESPRDATLTIAGAAPNADVSATLSVKQQGKRNEEAGIVSDIKITVSGGEASSTNGTSVIAKSFDGDYSTIYHSSYSGTEYPITLTYHLAGADALDYLLYYPRSESKNGLFGEVEILVKDKGSADFHKVKDFDFKGSSNATRVNFEPALTNVASVRFVVNSSEGDAGKAFATCAEMEFYRKSPENFDLLTLFADRSCSDLKAGITPEAIAACPQPFFKDIAHYMYENTYPREFRIEEYSAYPNPSEDAAVNKTGKYSKYDNPTGIAVYTGDELIVFAEGVEDEHPVSIKVQNLDAEAVKANYFDRGASYPISNGVNKITVGNDGLVYVMYFRADYATAPKLKLHFATGTVNGYFDVQKHATTAQWTRLLNAATFKFFDVVGKNAHLTFPTQSFRDYTKDRGVELINLYDKLLYLEWKFMGLLPPPDGYGNTEHSRIFRNRMYFVVMYESYMNATDYRTSYNANTLKDILDVSKIRNELGSNRDALWGLAHEAGHVNQTRPCFKWVGMTEVTNNLHSMYVQINLHENHTPKINTRLQMESVSGGAYVNRYEKAMNEYFTTGAAHNSVTDEFCRLIPLWQLHLYLTEVAGKGKGDNSIYVDLYQKLRADNTSRTNGGHQLAFVEKVCEVAQLNLEDFLRLFGFLTPIDITIDDYGKAAMKITQAEIDQMLPRIRKYPKPGGAKEFQYITDENVDMYKSGEGIVAYEVREGSEETGALKKVYLNTKQWPKTFNANSIEKPAGCRVYSVDVKGDRVRVK